MFMLITTSDARGVLLATNALVCSGALPYLKRIKLLKLNMAWPSGQEHIAIGRGCQLFDRVFAKRVMLTA
jgi:hypothetical protein